MNIIHKYKNNISRLSPICVLSPCVGSRAQHTVTSRASRPAAVPGDVIVPLRCWCWCWCDRWRFTNRLSSVCPCPSYRRGSTPALPRTGRTIWRIVSFRRCRRCPSLRHFAFLPNELCFLNCAMATRCHCSMLSACADPFPARRAKIIFLDWVKVTDSILH